jgi:hypothetical protein
MENYGEVLQCHMPKAAFRNNEKRAVLPIKSITVWIKKFANDMKKEQTRIF